MTAGPTMRRTLAAGLALAALGAGLGTPTADAGAGRKRTGLPCDVRKDGRKLGTTFVTSLTVIRLTCAQGKRVVKAYHACRRATGGVKGTCRAQVRGFRCTERRRRIPRQFAATATCKSGARLVRFSYTQVT
ncbi:MAG: hypothetical protein QOJ82_696 [Solirubrobacteraceae bacterium]|nr:hypothetical protein [Solirubrobacteraceae bacterium]